MKLSKIINLSLSKLEYLFSRRRLRYFKTFYINFRLLPLHQALKLPIFVYGNLKIDTLRGCAIINGPVCRGMISIGTKGRIEFVGYSTSKISCSGQIIFNGPAVLAIGVHLLVVKGSILYLGKNICTNAGVTLYAIDNIIIGDDTRFAPRGLVMSGDHHYTINIQNRKIYKNKAPIHIGKENWITTDVKINKGTITPDGTIVMSGSVLNKDYTKTIQPYSVIGGSPAKLIKEYQRRVFSLKSERSLLHFFDSSGEHSYCLEDSVDIDVFCKR